VAKSGNLSKKRVDFRPQSLRSIEQPSGASYLSLSTHTDDRIILYHQSCRNQAVSRDQVEKSIWIRTCTQGRGGYGAIEGAPPHPCAQLLLDIENYEVDSCLPNQKLDGCNSANRICDDQKIAWVETGASLGTAFKLGDRSI
jgi:hypothetical protein